MKIDKPCLTKEEIEQRRFDLATKVEVFEQAEKDAIILEEDLIPAIIARELSEMGFGTVQNRVEKNGKK